MNTVVAPQSPRVLMFSARADTGGGPAVLYELAQHLAGFDVQVAVPKEKPFFDRLEDLVGSRSMHPLPPRHEPVAFLRKALNLIRRVQPDLIHTHGRAAGSLVRPLAFAHRVPVVHTFHGYHPDQRSATKRFIYEQTERILGLGTRGSVAVCDVEADRLKQDSLASSLCVIPNGVAAPVPFPELSVEPRLIFPARLEPIKDPVGLVRVFSEISRPDWEMVVLGEGPLSDEVAALCDARSNVKLQGFSNELRPRWMGASVVVSNSVSEGLPLTPLEALSDGLLALLSDIPAHREIQKTIPDGVVLFERNESESFETGLARVSDLVRDIPLRRRSAECAQRAFGVDKMAGAYADLYRSILSG